MITQDQYQEISGRLARYNQWAEQFKKPNGWTVITTEELKGAPCQVSNDERSSLEVYDFVNNPPEKYFLYINTERNEATTWTGEKLGFVSFGRTYKDSFGGTRVAINVYAINGKTYHGTYYKSSGDYARIKQFKGRK